MERVKKSIEKQQDTFIRELTDHSTLNPYPLEFAKVLLSDIEKQVEGSSQSLEDRQEDVQKAKERLAAGEHIHPHDHVDEKRKLRNKCFERHEELLNVRETLRDYTHKTSSHRKSFGESLLNFKKSRKSLAVSDNPLHNIYLESRNKLREVKKAAESLVHKKVLMLSVKEAIKSTIDELREGHASVGYDIQRHGQHRATDVLRHSCIPQEWLTVAEKVAGILQNESHPITQNHHAFCTTVIEQCQAALFEQQLVNQSDQRPNKGGNSKASPHASQLDMKAHPETDEMVSAHSEIASVNSETVSLHSGMSVDNHTIAWSTAETSSQSGSSSFRDSHSVTVDSSSQSEMSIGQSQLVSNCDFEICDSLVQLEGQLDSEDIVIVHDTNKNNLKIVVDKLKKDIRQHFENITLNLQTELGHTTHTSYKNIWLKYEVHFFEMTMPCIVKLYVACYFHICERLCRSTSELTASDLDLAGSVFVDMLQGESSATTPDDVFSSEQNSPIKLNFDLPPDRAEYDTPKPEQSTSQSLSYEDNTQTTNNPDHCRQDACNRHSSESSAMSGSATQTVKKVTIHYPSSVTVIYNRRTWPMFKTALQGEVEYGVDALMINTDDTNAPQPLVVTANMSPPHTPSNLFEGKQVLLRPQFRQMFQPAVECMWAAIQDNIPLIKLQHLHKCLREINSKLSDFQRQEYKESIGACSDELIDMLVILLCNCDVKESAQLYPHLMLLNDLIPPFFEGGPYSFSLVQFAVAFQFVQDRLVLRKRCPNHNL